MISALFFCGFKVTRHIWEQQCCVGLYDTLVFIKRGQIEKQTDQGLILDAEEPKEGRWQAGDLARPWAMMSSHFYKTLHIGTLGRTHMHGWIYENFTSRQVYWWNLKQLRGIPINKWEEVVLPNSISTCSVIPRLCGTQTSLATLSPITELKQKPTTCLSQITVSLLRLFPPLWKLGWDGSLFLLSDTSWLWSKLPRPKNR